MSLFKSGFAMQNQSIKQDSAITTGGCSVTFAAVSGRNIYLDAVTGFSDANSIIEAKTALTGTLATTVDPTVVGTNTLFLTELAAGDIVKISDTSEYLEVLSVTTNLAFEATTSAVNVDASSVGHVIAGRSACLANTDINWQANGTVKGKEGKALIVALLTSTSAAHINCSTFTN